MHNSVLPVFALVLCRHVTVGFMSPSCPSAFVWPSDSPRPQTDPRGASGSPAAAAPPGRCHPRGSCRRSWRCLRETSPSLLWWMSEDEEGREPGSCTLIGWGGRGVGRWARLLCWCCGWCWWRDWSSRTFRQRDRGGGCFKGCDFGVKAPPSGGTNRSVDRKELFSGCLILNFYLVWYKKLNTKGRTLTDTFCFN